MCRIGGMTVFAAVDQAADGNVESVAAAKLLGMAIFAEVEAEVGLGIGAVGVRVAIRPVGRVWSDARAVGMAAGGAAVGIGKTGGKAARSSRHRAGAG